MFGPLHNPRPSGPSPVPLPTLDELRGRKVVQWGLAYLAGAWLTLQVLKLVSDSFGWSGFWVRAAIIVLGVGLVAALVLAWYHGERREQRVSGTELTILAALLGLAGLGVMIVGGRGEAAPAGAAAAALAPDVDQTTLAVLPFAAVGADSAGFAGALADGLTSELLATLARSPALRVAARGSAAAFEGTNAPADSIGRALNVARYVEGTVQAAAGGRVRGAVQLVSTATGLQEWAETYDRTGADALALQDDVARAVAAQLQVQITSARPRGTENAEAYALALDGWRTVRRGGDVGLYVPAALALFERAVAADSTYAHAWSGLATARWQMAFGNLSSNSEADWAAARSAAERALALDPAEGEAHLSLGLIATQHDHDTAAAVAHYERAVAANPSDAFALAQLATAYQFLGNEAAALRAAGRAAALDPLSAPTLLRASYVYSYTGRHDRAVALARDALAPDDTSALYALANALAIAGQTDEAARVADRLVALSPDVESNYWIASYAWARAGDRVGAEAALGRITEDANYFRTAVEAALGRPDSAFAALDRSVAADESLVELEVDPWSAPLHGDPRWALLTSRVQVRGSEAGG